MPGAPLNRIQLCGALVVRIEGADVTRALPGAQGRLLFAYLVTHRARQLTRGELSDLLWGDAPPAEAATALRAVLSKLRRALAVGARECLPPGELLRLSLAPDAWVDTEVAAQALHDAQAAVAQQEDVRAWIAAHIALNIGSRVFLPGHENPWVFERRLELQEIGLNSLEALAACAVRLGGPELDTAVRAAGELVTRSPYRESGYGHLMRALAAQGNAAEALLVYERLRVRLREDLGAIPGADLQALHAELLDPRPSGQA